VSRFDLVIFDCDGVLVDSERLAIRTEAGDPLGPRLAFSESDIVDRFVGRSAAYMHQEIERHLGRRVDWDADFERRYEEVFKRELVPVSGVVEALDQIRVSTCVASSELTRGCSSPWNHGTPGSIPGTDLQCRRSGAWKAGSDVFLHAARRMGVPPGRCAVVEDSVSGMTAGLAAEMAVFAFRWESLVRFNSPSTELSSRRHAGFAELLLAD